MKPESERGLVSILGPNRSLLRKRRRRFRIGLGRPKLGLSRRRFPPGGLKLVDAQEVSILLFPDDALFSAEDEILDESFLVIIFS